MSNTIVTRPSDTFIVTGVDVHNRRFVRHTSTYLMCKAINVYKGSRWLLRDNHRILIERVSN